MATVDQRLAIDELQEATREAQRVADFPMVAHLARELIDRCHAQGDLAGEGNGFAYLGGALVGQNNATDAASAFRRSRELYEKAGDRSGIVRALNGLGVVAMDLNLDLRRARRFLDEALPLAREVGEKRLLGVVLGNYCEVQRFEADYSGAIRSAREALELLREVGDEPRAAWQLINIGHCEFIRRNHPVAIASLRAAYEYLARSSYDARMIAWYSDVWFIVAAGLKQWQVAAQLLGFVNQVREDKKLVRLQLLMPWIASPTEAMWKSLPGEHVAALIAQGRTLSFEEAEALTHGPPFD